MLRFITHLGDSALLIPATIVVVLYLVVCGFHRLAGAWLISIVGCMAVTLVAKIGFYIATCGSRSGDMDIMSPSGHTSFSFAFYGGLAVLLANGRSDWTRRGITAAGFVLALAIGLTRILIHVHTVTEVLVGIVIGGAAVALFAFLHGRAGRPDVRALPLVALVVLTAALLHGVLLNAEPKIRALAEWLRLSVGVCS